MRFALFLLAIPLAAQAPGRAPPPPPPTTQLSYAPVYFVTAGGGGQAPGHGAAFAYWSVSKFIGQNNWASVIQEYSTSKGQVVTCPLAGISHVVAQMGPVSVGLVGAGGACSGTTAGASGAASGQAFANFHIAGSWSIIATARKTFTNAGSDAVKISLGVGWGE